MRIWFGLVVVLLLVPFPLGPAGAADGALYSIGVPGFKFEYSDEPVLVLEGAPGDPLPLKSTAHLSMVTPALHNVSGAFVSSFFQFNNPKFVFPADSMQNFADYL